MGGDVHAGRPHLLAVDQPAINAVAGFRHGGGFHVGGVAAVIRLGQAEGSDAVAGESSQDELLLLGFGPEAFEHGDEGEIAHDAVFILQIIVQAQALGGELVADHCHPQVGTILAAIFLWRRKPPVAGLVGADAGLAQQQFPFAPWQPTMFEIGARPFAAVIEETDIVVLLLKRLDLGYDEGVKLDQIGNQIGGQREIHGWFLPFAATVGRRAVRQNWLIGGGASRNSGDGFCVIMAQIFRSILQNGHK